MIGTVLRLAESALAVVGVRLEERWVPVDETGDRWAPRPLKTALEDLAENPVGGVYTDGGRKPGIVEILREVRFVSEWTEV